MTLKSPLSVSLQQPLLHKPRCKSHWQAVDADCLALSQGVVKGERPGETVYYSLLLYPHLYVDA